MMRRRHFLSGAAFGTTTLLAACGKGWVYDDQDLDSRKSLPPLQFRLTDVATGRPVTEADFRGKVVMLYFGYTNCPNVCPLTLYETVQIFRKLGPMANDVRFLFVTVDPERDTPPILTRYLALYGSPNLVGLRGTPAELKATAARYRAAFSVHPSPDPRKYTVTHTSAVYVFDKSGKPAFICAGLSSKTPHLAGITRDLRHVIEG